MKISDEDKAYLILKYGNFYDNVDLLNKNVPRPLLREIHAARRNSGRQPVYRRKHLIEIAEEYLLGDSHA